MRGRGESARLRVGERGERVAQRHLRTQGYRLLATNARSRWGEIDILAEAPDGRTLVLVEVKSRRLDAGDAENARNAADIFRPEFHVNAQKQRQLVRLGVQIAQRYKLTDRPFRFDVIGVDLVASGKPVVRHYEGAFESPV